MHHFYHYISVRYKDTSAAAARSIVVRILMANVVWYGWYAEQVDAVTAFIYPPIGDWEVHMKLPEGHKKPEFVAKLRKTLYGLKQAASEWFETLKAL